VEEGTAGLKMVAQRLVPHPTLPLTAVEIVPHDKMARLQAVDAQLVRPARFGVEFQKTHERVRC